MLSASRCELSPAIKFGLTQACIGLTLDPSLHG